MIEELGPDLFRRSPKWKSIANGLMLNETFGVRDYRLITDSLTSRVAKKIIKQDYPKSLAQTARYLSPEAYKVASESFIRSGQSFGAKISAVKRNLAEIMPEPWKPKLGIKQKFIDEAVPFYRLENDLREMTGSEFNNLVRELQSFPKKTPRNEVFGKVLSDTQEQYITQTTKEVRALWDSLRPHDEYGFIDATRIKPFIEKHPKLRAIADDAIIAELETKAGIEGLTFDELISELKIEKTYKTDFIKRFLTDFYDGIPHKPDNHDVWVKDIAKKLSDEELSVKVFEDAIEEMRKLSDSYKGGLARFTPWKVLTEKDLKARWQDPVEDLLLAQVVKKRGNY